MEAGVYLCLCACSTGSRYLGVQLGKHYSFQRNFLKSNCQVKRRHGLDRARWEKKKKGAFALKHQMLVHLKAVKKFKDFHSVLVVWSLIISNWDILLVFNKQVMTDFTGCLQPQDAVTSRQRRAQLVPAHGGANSAGLPHRPASTAVLLVPGLSSMGSSALCCQQPGSRAWVQVRGRNILSGPFLVKIGPLQNPVLEYHRWSQLFNNNRDKTLELRENIMPDVPAVSQKKGYLGCVSTGADVLLSFSVPFQMRL